MSRISKAKIILNRTEARKKEKQFVEVELRGTSISLLSAKVWNLFNYLHILEINLSEHYHFFNNNNN